MTHAGLGAAAAAVAAGLAIALALIVRHDTTTPPAGISAALAHGIAFPLGWFLTWATAHSSWAVAKASDLGPGIVGP